MENASQPAIIPGAWETGHVGVLIRSEDVNIVKAAPAMYAALESLLDALSALSNPSELIDLVGKEEADKIFAALRAARGEA